MLDWLASGLSSVQGLSLDAPIVLGPVLTIVAVLLMNEWIVPGRTHRRVIKENKELRELVEKIIPLAQSMVEATEAMTATAERSVRVMEDVVNTMGGARPVYKASR